MGGEAARRTFAARSSQHACLLQHETLHAADAVGAPRAVVQPHHEALEKDELAQRQTGPQRLSPLLLAGTVQYVEKKAAPPFSRTSVNF